VSHGSPPILDLFFFRIVLYGRLTAASCYAVDDVMAHVHTFGVVAPDAAGIIQ
jgi:hypothetical protein